MAARQDLGTDCARTPWSLNEPRKLPHAEGPRACGNVLGFCRRPPCRPQSVPRIKSGRASKGVKSRRIRCPPTAEAGPACARPTPAHEAPAAQPAYWLAQRAAPAGLAPRPRTAPRAPPAVGQRLLDARCMLLLLPPRGTHASGDGLRGPVKNAMGPSLFYRNYAFGPPRGL